MTRWWSDRRIRRTPDARPADTASAHPITTYDAARITRIFEQVVREGRAVANGAPAATTAHGAPRHDLQALDRYIALAGLILWAREQEPLSPDVVSSRAQVDLILSRIDAARAGELLARELTRIEAMPVDTVNPTGKPLVWHVSLNRTATTALAKSVPAVKGDAARTLFKVTCSEIAWAVLDSGIDGSHAALQDANAQSRVRKAFDFTSFRKIVSLGNSDPAVRAANRAELLQDRDRLAHPPTEEAADAALAELADSARRRAPIHWELVEPFIEIKPDTPPLSHHGTHVAGIIGASKTAAEKQAGFASEDFADGMCPDIQLYDFRVAGPSLRDTEFAIIAALQYIRQLNDRDNFFSIHGANLSLSIPHDVRNFACGRTPICNECERLVDAGIVVVAAAGNHGYKTFETSDGAYEGYASFSITDPGNADGVITVGATHRYWPHTYGVSFFSSRGPTGDGRLKPDLVAPGERIRAPLPGSTPNGNEWGDLDGTSMAAPHVSGAAAMLMARYSELIGQPRRVKRILCESATDLGRERTFQGHGMLDVLRALQAV